MISCTKPSSHLLAWTSQLGAALLAATFVVFELAHLAAGAGAGTLVLAAGNVPALLLALLLGAALLAAALVIFDLAHLAAGGNDRADRHAACFCT